MKKDFELYSSYENKVRKLVNVSTILFVTILFGSLCLNLCVFSVDESKQTLVDILLIFLILSVVIFCKRQLFEDNLRKQLIFVLVLFFVLPYFHVFCPEKYLNSKQVFLVYYGFFLLFLYFFGKLLRSYLRYVTKLKRDYESLACQNNSNRLFNLIGKSVFHDLSTPMSVVYGIAGMLRNDSLDENTKEEALNQLSIAVRQIDDILDTSTLLIRGDYSDTCFSPVTEITKLVSLVSSRIKRVGITVDIQGDEKLTITGDRGMFARVCMNILVNSIEEFERSKKLGANICIKVFEKDGCVVNVFSDNGNGFSKDARVGCGLEFCRLVVKEKFKGSLKIRSKAGKYCKVFLYFPSS
ncbi:MAG TPA: HAMP domain-containing sensor histidine kinase [Candidatus Dojkabacteria bacterium]|nr:HAMP domain-containing sensor histidine kinase [Candidatus Dojkabacteria bacterium]